jgi:outer membrane protein insertion porin family
MHIKPGELYSQTNFYKTQNSFARTGVWQSVNIDVKEIKDSVGLIDMTVQLIPAGQYVREASIEASYSANSNTNSTSTVNAGNLLGTSLNLGFTNRNLAQEGIRWTSGLRAGIELNLNRSNSSSNSIVNSTELGLNNTFAIPRFLIPLKKLNNHPRFSLPQTFVVANTSIINRINLFNLQTAKFEYGYSWRNRKNAEFGLKLLNIEFARIFNESESFKQTLRDNPFLAYSFNTALVAGPNASYATSKTNRLHPSRRNNFKLNLETSIFGLFSKYNTRFIKFDVEQKQTRVFLKSEVVMRYFLGVGIPLGKDVTLPFFKQYFGGGSNSMRGWPIRGIGRGSQQLAPYANNRFNDRTGDIQLEGNFEYRYNISQITSWLNLKGAFFVDAGNVWNMRVNNQYAQDSAVFRFANAWRDIGVNIGPGFRFDVTYLQLRLDLGFRIKRPEQGNVNNGWQFPVVGVKDVLPKLFSKGGADQIYRRWRYENFNFTIGINMPF